MPTFSATLAQAAAVVVAIAFVTFAGLMVHWSLGRTWGLSSHWGGRYEVLPTSLRVADAISFAAFTFGAFVVIGRAWSLDQIASEGFFTAAAWSFVALMGLSGIMNIASSAKWERRLLGPSALVIAALCFIIARSEWTGG